MYAKIENGQITETRGNLKALYPNTSFPRTMPDEHDGWVKVQDGERGEFETPSEITLVGGVPVQQYAFDGSLVANHLAAYRWQVENDGITINGVTVQTDLNSRANLLGAKELGISIKWKTPDGFVTLTAEQVAAIATAVGMHIQKCFEVEAALSSQTFTSIEALETAFNAAMEV